MRGEMKGHGGQGLQRMTSRGQNVLSVGIWLWKWSLKRSVQSHGKQERLQLMQLNPSWPITTVSVKAGLRVQYEDKYAVKLLKTGRSLTSGVMKILEKPVRSEVRFPQRRRRCCVHAEQSFQRSASCLSQQASLTTHPDSGPGCSTSCLGSKSADKWKFAPHYHFSWTQIWVWAGTQTRLFI